MKAIHKVSGMKHELTLAGYTYTLEVDGKDILIINKDRSAVDDIFQFDKVLTNGMEDLGDESIVSHVRKNWMCVTDVLESAI